MVTVHLEDGADRLLLEPLQRVARICAGAVGKLVGGGWTGGREGSVPSETVAEIDAGQVEAGDGCREQALGQGIGGHGHAEFSDCSCGTPLLRACRRPATADPATRPARRMTYAVSA